MTRASHGTLLVLTGLSDPGFCATAFEVIGTLSMATASILALPLRTIVSFVVWEAFAYMTCAIAVTVACFRACLVITRLASPQVFTQACAVDATPMSTTITCTRQ